MKDRPEMTAISSGVARMLRRLGMGDVETLIQLKDDWDAVSGRPWAGVSRPMGIRDGELVVEALDPGQVTLLRYAAGSLVKAIEERFGAGTIDRVRVVAPPPGGPR